MSQIPQKTAAASQAVIDEIRFEQGLRIINNLYEKGMLTPEQRDTAIRLYAGIYRPMSPEFQCFLS